MPYIKKEDREKYEDIINEAVRRIHCGNKIPSAGELNYVISSIIWKLFDINPSYTTGNNFMGVLDCVKQEFYRRKLAPYEDEKIKENGDIQ